MTSTYWTEAISEIFEEHGVTATAEQMAKVASDVELLSSTAGEYSSESVIRPGDEEVTKLRTELTLEKQKVVCKECRGHGFIGDSSDPTRYESECFVCKGAGRI